MAKSETFSFFGFARSILALKLKLVSEQLSVKQIESFIQERIIAKQNKNYELADKIRDQLLNQGIILEDNLDETNWRRS